MEINRSNVMEIIDKSGLKPDKDYGQNYLLEPDICKRIVELLNIEEKDNVLEIGPGIGSLTHFLSTYKSDITLVDIDERMVDFLKILYKEQNIKLVLSDIRKHDVSNYTKIIGNLPYNITTETVEYLMMNAKRCKVMVLMCQAEAFPRFNDVSGKDYGPLSVLIHLLGKSKKQFNVKPGSFYPAPKCASTVFTIEKDDSANYQDCLNVYKLAKKLFLNRRKTIYNNLSSYLNDKEKALSVLEAVKIAPNRRPEEISPIEFYQLHNALKSN